MTCSREAYFDCRRRGGIACPERTVLRFTGGDRVRFLNGQLSADVRKLQPGTARPACVTTAKGKLCADVFVTATTEALIIDADESLRETLPARFERYIVADDVQMEDVSLGLQLYHLLPPLGEPMEQFLTQELRDMGAVVTRRLGREGLDFFEPVTSELWNRFSPEVAAIDDPLFETLRIETGIPRWGAELGEDTLPPEAGLDRTHIDYHKGCYIGQEVISRLKSVGHVNRQLTGFVAEDGEPPVVGAAIFSPDSDRPAGVITSVAFSFALEKPIALGYLRRGSPTGGLLARPAEPTSAAVRVAARPLPFVLS